MLPVEAEAYLEGWDAAIVGKQSRENPYRMPLERARAWAKRKAAAWANGNRDCWSGKAFTDPRK